MCAALDVNMKKAMKKRIPLLPQIAQVAVGSSNKLTTMSIRY